MPSSDHLAVRGYSGRPILKPPVWTWEVPLYFFVGGAAGAAAVIAAVALGLGTEPRLARAALWVAAVGGALSPVLLTSDLGRPARALYMFRVFKRQSAISVGSWTLLLFGTTSAAALAGHELGFRTLSGLAAAVSALSGLGMATYTGVLLGATAIPVWNERRRLLPLHMGVTSLGAAAAILLLLAPGAAPAARLLVAAAVAECGIGLALELDRRPSGRPLHEGPSGRRLRLGAALAGPLALGAAWLSLPLASVAFLAGALLLRFGWIAAGRASAADPAAVLGPPTQRRT